MPMVKANGVQLNVMRVPASARADGTGPPVVMLHGIVIDNLSSFFYTLAQQVSVDHEVVMYDLRGHGRSERPVTGYGLDDHVADLGGLLDTLGLTDPVILLGNSFGGGVALAYAMANPERVAGLVLIEAHFPVPGGAAAMSAMLDRIGELARQGLAIEPQLRQLRRVPPGSLPALHEVGLSADQVAFVTYWIETTPARKLMQMARTADGLVNGTTLVEDVLGEVPLVDSDLAAVTCPTLLVYGEQSDIVERAHQLAGVLPRAELTVLPDVDHSVLMGATEALRDRLLPWLAQRRLAAGSRAAVAVAGGGRAGFAADGPGEAPAGSAS